MKRPFRRGNVAPSSRDETEPRSIKTIWMFPYMVGPPNRLFYTRVFHINHPFFGVFPPFLETHHILNGMMLPAEPQGKRSHGKTSIASQVDLVGFVQVIPLLPLGFGS